MYGVLTWGATMPPGFPIDVPQNSGNMVHARAPFEMFPNSVGIDFGFKEEGYDSFVDFVNDRCEALIVPLANSLRTDPAHDARGFSHVKSLDKYEVPIIAFGLGAQAPTTSMEDLQLGPGMIEFVRFLSERATAVSVRGEFTYNIFAKYGSTERVFNTGCPSYYSHPEAFAALKSRLSVDSGFARAAFAGSLHHTPGPMAQLYRAIEEDLYIIEPVNPSLHKFYLDCKNDVPDLQPAYFLKKLLQRPEWNLDRLKSFMLRRYQLFRNMETWLEFNRESVDGTIGSRFHVNMASVLSGVPAVWVVHDSRTQELCDRLSLPYVAEGDLGEKPYREHMADASFESMLSAVDSNFDYFNEFLRAAGLPEIAKPQVA